MKYTTDYESAKYFVGALFKTNNFGYVEILGKIYRKGRDPFYVIKFLDTGTITRAEASNISRGGVKDLNARTYHGVGYIGVGVHKTGSRGRSNKQWTVWNGMIERCYGDNPKYLSYKGKVTVCERWHSFQNFCDDLPKIKGYDLWLKGGCAIDKDKSGKNLYSLDTVEFIPISENSKERQERVGTTITERNSKGQIVKSGTARV